MLANRRIIWICLLISILVFLLFNVLGCVKDNKEADTPANNSTESNNTDENLERLKKEVAALRKQIDKAKELKSNDNVLSNDIVISSEEKEKELKRVEESEAKLIEQSKEIEERIKELQQRGKANESKTND